jgi:hypothetical protein
VGVVVGVGVVVVIFLLLLLLLMLKIGATCCKPWHLLLSQGDRISL